MYRNNNSFPLTPKEEVVGGILDFKRRWHAFATVGWRARGCVDSVDALVVADGTVDCGQIQPSHRTILTLSGIRGSINRATLLGHGNAELLGGCSVEVEFRNRASEEMMTHQFEIGWR